MSQRTVVEVITAQAASDGDGVKLLRVFGGGNLSRFDPFLMLDEFGSESADDYIGGFPLTHTEALKPSPTCSRAKWNTKIIWVTRAF